MSTGNRRRPLLNRQDLRVVLDTNVYFSAFSYPKGIPSQIWRRARERQFTLLVSPAIMRELANVLRRYLGWSEPAIVSRLKLMAKLAEIVNPKMRLKEIVEDDDDNRILECALAGKADLIISGDNHLLRLRAFRGIAIVRPRDFLRMFEQ